MTAEPKVLKSNKNYVYIAQSKPRYFEAVMFDGTHRSGAHVETWMKVHYGGGEYLSHFSVVRIPTDSGVVLARVGDWVVKQPDGSFEVVGHDEFERNYILESVKEE